MQFKKYNLYEIIDKTLIQGRVGKITDRGIPLFWSASAVEFNVTGKQFWFEYECPFNVVGIYLRIEVDGADIARFMITQGIHTVCAFGNAAWIDENGIAHKHELDENGKPCERDYHLIKNAIIDFCKAIHKTRPDGYIFWCYNVMEDNVNDIVIDALNEYSAIENDKKAFSVKLTIPDASCMGSIQHPGAKAHALYAEVLTEKIRNACNYNRKGRMR